MPIIFKLVGFTQNNYVIHDNYKGVMNYDLITKLFTFWGITEVELDKIKFITDSEQITNTYKNFIIESDVLRIIFVFTTDSLIKIKLQEIFMKVGINTVEEYKQNNDISQPLTQSCEKSEDILENTDEIINSINAKTILLFSDPDFKNLISIYLRKPELFNILSQYIQSGDIVKELSNSQVPKDYSDLCSHIQSLDLDISEEIIMEKLNRYSGHLNLTVRSILHDLSKN